MVAEDPSPPETIPRSPHGSPHAGPSKQASTTPAALVLKWAGRALLVIAGLLAVDVLGELAARTAYLSHLGPRGVAGDDGITRTT